MERRKEEFNLLGRRPDSVKRDLFGRVLPSTAADVSPSKYTCYG